MKLLESLELIGPGQWLDRPVVDQTLQLHPAELQYLAMHAPQCHQRLLLLLNAAGLQAETNQLTTPGMMPSDSAPSAARYAGLWLAELGLILQRWAGHRVSWADACLLHTHRDGTILLRALFEIEDPSIGRESADLALQLLNLAMNTDANTDVTLNLDEPLMDRLAAYESKAAARVLPWDTEVLIAAATARDIPVCNLDREPYEPIVGDFRLRNNGLLRFGYGCYQQIVDGNLCLQRSAKVLQQFRQPGAAFNLLCKLGIPVTRSGSVIPAGERYRFLCADQQLVAVIDSHGIEVTELCDISWLEAAAQIAQQLEVGMLVLSAYSTDLSADLRTGKGAFIDLDISPQLDELIPPGGELHRLMADDFISWMFPQGHPSRIPLFSVTGTNGKTTICRMLARISRQAGFRVGMACTDGVYLNGQLLEAGDYSGREGHHLVLESKEINLAVLETARGSVLHSGFCFDHSDVAICTNVTPEHLGEYGIHTIQQMSEIKQLILQRARIAAVLNFDDARCGEMGRALALSAQGRRICWSSCFSSAAEVAAQTRRADRVIFLEPHEGVQWVSSYQKGTITRLMPLHEIPASFNGTATHNISNALQAIAAALELGLGWSVIKSAMGSFAMSIEDTPGRLNIHTGPGFPVLLDFVQNIDGMRVLCEFVHAQAVTGKRILVMSVLGRHDNATVREFAQLAAQNFDYFICRNYGKTYAHRSKEEIPLLLREGLLAAGVADQHIAVELDERPAVNRALELAEAGDLVVILCGIRPRDTWQQISEFSRCMA